MSVFYTKTQVDSLAVVIGERIKSVKGEKGDDGNTIIDQRTQQAIKIWTGTQVQYDAVTPKDANTLYVVKP